MPNDFTRGVRQWGAAVPAAITSGALTPMGPRAVAALARSLWQLGPTPALLLAASAIRFPDRVALIDDSGPLTYRQLQLRAQAIAASVYALAPSAPRSVGIVCRNHRGFVEAMIAGAQLGAELVFINTELTPQQLQAILRRHEPDVLVFDEEYAAAVRDAQYEGLRVLGWRQNPDAEDLPTLDDLAGQRHPTPPRVSRAVKLTLLTSGTTGLAKGVPRAIKLRQLVLMCVTAMATVRLRSRDRVFVAPPFFHGFGLAALLGPLALGGTALCRRRFDAAQAIEDIARERLTVLMAVPVMLQRILALPGLDKGIACGLSLRLIVTGAAPISSSTVSGVLNAFGPILVNGYGSTEAGVVAIAAPEDLVAAPNTIGRTALGVSVRILSEDRREVPDGETGMIFVRGGLEYEGYTPDKAARPTAKEVVDGHVNTGDMGHFDADGRLYIDGRSDDMIVSGGENVFPGEVEDRLTTHPDIADAVVIGVPDDEYGQVLRAFVVAAAGACAPSEDALKAHIRDGLERYKVPKRFVVLDEIPRNASGKVFRAQLHSLGAS
ncbi:fatty-acid--CoA ligase [Mycobacteroides saopaulense]|uniref:AMP-binding protein n=1 Tax=Mycobacteroides saopaulense TaxID=1578165 RepID=UPI0007230CC1|nr:AMP-binding protein [Mycobacteroides saopaulense]ALR11778.1 fatty-acid--CoA ligase [Mycobacteroides saopaulense]